MYSAFTIACKYLYYRCTAMNGRGHGMHSPFVYRLIREVLIDKQYRQAYDMPEHYRKDLLRDHTMLQIRDFGAGSVSGQHVDRMVSSIARISVKHQRYASLLCRLGQFLQSRRVLELGTSLGVTTMYLAAIPGVEQVITMEGADAVADLAERAFRDRQLTKVKLVRGQFDQQLEAVLREMQIVDLVYIDGNHRKQPTLCYFEQVLPLLPNGGCIVLDDIHWSREMEEAWTAICADPRVRLSIDLFAIGLVFIRREQLQKQHFTIRY